MRLKFCINYFGMYYGLKALVFFKDQCFHKHTVYHVDIGSSKWKYFCWKKSQ